MKNKLGSIMLVDDDDITNYLHQVIITKAEVASQIITKQDGQEALEYLMSLPLETTDSNTLPPSIILLDINMPVMGGVEFLAHHSQLPLHQQAKKIVVMLTTSLNADVKMEVENLPCQPVFRNKPLTKEILLGLIEEFFPENL